MAALVMESGPKLVTVVSVLGFCFSIFSTSGYKWNFLMKSFLKLLKATSIIAKRNQTCKWWNGLEICQIKGEKLFGISKTKIQVKFDLHHESFVNTNLRVSPFAEFLSNSMSNRCVSWCVCSTFRSSLFPHSLLA